MANETKRPAILTEWGLHADWVVKPLIEAGSEVAGCDIDRVPEELATGKYNVLVLGRYAFWRKTKQEELAAVHALRDAVVDFTAKGGGVFFAAPGITVIPMHEVFEPLGIKLLKLGIEHPSRTHQHGNQRYGYSAEISGPVADGVRNIWYPVDLGHATALWPLLAQEDDGWEYVARTAPGSHTVDLLMEGYGLPTERQNGNLYPDTVPIMAVRDGLPGRIAVCGIPAGFCIYSPHNFPTAHRLLVDGFEDKPSDLRALVFNTLSWLAEPSMAAGALGGGITHPQMLEPQAPRFPDDPPVIWPSREFPADSAIRRGLIGARTAYSTGSGTVAEYVAKAQAAGHDFIVFLEEFTALNEDKLQALKADCAACTTENFFAVPGYTIKDCVGTHYFAYGFEIVLPQADLLNDEGTMLSTRAVSIGRNAERVENVLCSFVFGELKMRCRKGIYMHAATPKPITHNRFNDSIALVTWENGRVIEDVRDQYQMLMDKGLRLNPTVLTFMNNPQDFDRAVAGGWRNTMIEPYETMQDTVLRKYMAPELEWWGKLDTELARKPWYRFDRWQYGLPFQSITNGPEIRAWAASASNRDPEWRGTDTDIPPTADWFRTDVATLRLRIKVMSDVGLDEVRLMDGVRVIRRWACHGDHTFEQEMDITHHQQMHLMLEAHDVNGGTACTSDFFTFRRDWCEFYCADRNNPLTIGFEKDERGLAFGWSGTEHLTYDNGNWGGNSPWIGRWWYSGDHMHPAPKDPVNDVIQPTDGGISDGAAGLHLQVKMPPLDPPELGLMVDPLQEMISTDAAICGFTVDQGYDLNDPYFLGTKDNTGFGLFAGYPTRYLYLKRRAMVFRPRPHALTTMLYQHELRWKRDPQLTEPLNVGWLDSQPAHVFHGRDGRRMELPGTSPDGLELRWHRGEAVACWTNGARPAIFINDGADLLLVREPGNGGRIGLRLPVDELPTASVAATIRIIGIGGTHHHRDPNIVETLRAAMGLDGNPAYDLTLEQGKVLSQRLFLELDALGTDGTAFSIPQADLPMALPVTVRHLNDNWSAVLIDRDRRRWRPLGMLDGCAYATLDTSAGDTRIFIGHPVTATTRDVVLNFTQVGSDAWVLEVHNPTRRALETTVTLSPFVEFIDWPGETLALRPGASRFIALGTRVPV